jgi:hypothetical protein
MLNPRISTDSRRTYDPLLSLAVHGGHSLLPNLAYEILSMYVFDMASRIERVITPTNVTAANLLTNFVIEELAKTLQKSGFAHTEEWACTMLVPSFLYWNLLPPPGKVGPKTPIPSLEKSICVPS